MKSEGVGHRQESFLREQILAMLGEHERAEINFNEFVAILGRHNVKFYSPEEFKKMSKIFLGSGNSLPLLEPFQYLQLHCRQMLGSSTPVLLTRVLPRKTRLPAPPSPEPHSPQRCLQDFVILMKRRYGNEVNWFKVVGGMTVSVSIEAAPFRNNLQHILRNTPHRQCVEQILETFVEREGIVSWQRFMGVVKATIKLIAAELKGNQSSSKISLPPRVNTEPTENILTIKSTFIRNAKPTLNKQHHLSQTLYETSRDSMGPPSRQLQRTRYPSTTTHTEDVSLNLDMKKCTIHERLKTAICSDQRSGNLTASEIRSRPYRLGLKQRRRQQTQSCWHSDNKEL